SFEPLPKRSPCLLQQAWGCTFLCPFSVEKHESEALYEDAAFTLSIRKPIFGLCLLAEMLLITATAFALVRGKQKFAIMCYAALYGVALGTLTLLLIFFGHRVNAQLSAGIDLLKELELVESASPVSPERKEAALDAYRSSVLGVSHPKEVEAFLRHEKLHAVTLTFMGIPFDLGLLRAPGGKKTHFG
ncbi:unnamed protein product, partial [Effrenium voratum]